jgi:hypothetical protein
MKEDIKHFSYDTETDKIEKSIYKNFPYKKAKESVTVMTVINRINFTKSC